MFDPTIGRWLTQDPLAFAAGDADLYRYVGNGPTNQVDPFGLDYPGAPNLNNITSITVRLYPDRPETTTLAYQKNQFSEKELEIVSESFKRAYELIERAWAKIDLYLLGRLSAAEATELESQLNRWFSDGSAPLTKDQIRFIRQNLIDLLTYLAVKKKCVLIGNIKNQDQYGQNALRPWVPYGPLVIVIEFGKKYWNARPILQTGTWIHELSHLICQTVDNGYLNVFYNPRRGYYHPITKVPVILNTAQLLVNADTVEGFIIDTFVINPIVSAITPILALP
jgi:hypothetical protein